MEKKHITSFFIFYFFYGIVVLLLATLAMTCTDFGDYRTDIPTLVKHFETSSGRCITRSVLIGNGAITVILALYCSWALYSEKAELKKWIRHVLLTLLAFKVGYIFPTIRASNFTDEINANMNENFNLIPESTAANAQTFLEQNYDCCGVTNFKDYNRLYGKEVVDYPETCCINYVGVCSLADGMKPVGCFDKVTLVYNNTVGIVIALMVIGCLLEGIGERMVNHFIVSNTQRQT